MKLAGSDLWGAALKIPETIERGIDYPDSCSAAAWSPNPHHAVIASVHGDGINRLWDADTGMVIKRYLCQYDDYENIAFSPDGLLLASWTAYYQIRLWEVATGQEVRRFEGHRDWIYSMAFGPDGSLLVSGSVDKTIRLWHVATGQELRCLRGHVNHVNSVAFSPDGTKIISGSSDNTIRVWEAASGRCLAVIGILPEGWVAYTPDGRYKLGGESARGFWHGIGLCRFEAGELDPYVPGIRRVPLDEPLWEAEVNYSVPRS